MVHRRGFSFTDDSACITSPLSSGRHEGGSNGNQLFLHSLDTAAQLEHLRQIQSSAYQKLFQSEHLNYEDAWPSMSCALHDMNLWNEELPKSLPNNRIEPLKKLFRSDVLYSGILILSPNLAGTLNDYGKFLIFEYTAECADLMASACGEHEQFALYTYCHLLRTSFIADRFIRLLYYDPAVIFNDALPLAPFGSVPPNGPSTIPARTVGERVNRAYRTLTQLEKTMGHLGARFGFPEHLNDFKSQSNNIRRNLQTIYDNWTRSLGYSRSQYVTPALAPIGSFYEP